MKSLVKLVFMTIAFQAISYITSGQDNSNPVPYHSVDSIGRKYLNFNSIDPKFTCDSVASLIIKYGKVQNIPDQETKFLAILVQIKCSVSALNELSTVAGDTSHYQALILIESDQNGNPRVLFNLIDLKTLSTARDYAKTIVDFAPILLAAYTGDVGNFLAESGIATALGKYSVDAYYESAIENDPLIIFYPTIIPFKKFSGEVIKEIKSNHIYNEVKNVWESPVGTIANPMLKIVTSPETVIKEAGTVMKGTEKAIKKILKKLKF